MGLDTLSIVWKRLTLLFSSFLVIAKAAKATTSLRRLAQSKGLGSKKAKYMFAFDY